MSVRVTLQDTVALKYCRRGTQIFMQRNGLDWHRFRTEGIPVEEVEHMDDEMIQAAIGQARKRQAGDA